MIGLRPFSSRVRSTRVRKAGASDIGAIGWDLTTWQYGLPLLNVRHLD